MPTAPPTSDRTELATIAARTALLDGLGDGELLIHELYQSIQGESTWAGLPCAFVRTSVCDLRCSWCFAPETPVLMADWSWRPIGELRPGDEIIGTDAGAGPGRQPKVAVGMVTECHTREAETVLVNGEVRCTPDHKFWLTGKSAEGQSVAHNGWREASRIVGLRVQYLAGPVARDEAEYERGWLAGMADGDGCFWTLKHRRGYRRFRLALKEPVLLDRFAQFAARAGHHLHAAAHARTGFKGPGTMDALWLTADARALAFEGWLAQDIDSDVWRYGYLGGIIDAEGSLSRRLLRVAQCPQVNRPTWDRIERVLTGLQLKFTAEPGGFYLHRSGGELWRILANARPAKPSVLRNACRSNPSFSRVIESVAPTGVREPVVTLSTTLGCYVAAGYVVKNCDTPHAFKHGTRRTLESVLAEVLALGCPLVEVTGGEPLLQPAVLPLMSRLADAGRTVLLETSGAHPTDGVDERVRIVLDVKCPGSGEAHRNHWPNLARLRPVDEVKFVLAGRADFDYAVRVIREHALEGRAQLLMSTVFGGPEPREVVEWLLAEKLWGVRFQLQMHKYIWHPKARGV